MAYDFGVGFVHSPPSAKMAFMPSESLIQQWDQTDNPAVKRGVGIHLNPKIGADWQLRGQQKRVVTPGAE